MRVERAPLDADVIVLTALTVEEKATVRALGTCSVDVWRGRVLHIGEAGELRVLVFPAEGMGNISSAEASARVISTWNPRYILLVGIAGGVRSEGDDLRLGDVLVPDQVIGYELGKIRPSDLKRRYEVYRPDPVLLATARGLSPQEWALAITSARPGSPAGRIIPRAHFGPLLTGEKIVSDEAAIADVRSTWPKALGVEMESLGVAAAAYRSGCGFLTVKAVSDFADAAKNDEWQFYAAEAAARLAVAVLARAPVRPGQDLQRRTPVTAPVSFPGHVKLQVCGHLHDGWEDVADLVGVPRHDKARFRPGNEPRDLWEWLDQRGRLTELPGILAAAGRDDLAGIMRGPRP
jgi:nucleoside phosphorylase